MSGGALDYAYSRVNDVADAVASRAKTPQQRAFAKHLERVATALRDLEWVWSGDSAAGYENAAIEACFSSEFLLSACLMDARKTIEELGSLVNRMEEQK